MHTSQLQLSYEPMSVTQTLDSSPMVRILVWQVRPLELPGLGSRADEPLCLGAKHVPSSKEEALAWGREERQKLISALADGIAPLTSEPYAIFGFSQGAMLGGLLIGELEARGLPPPILFIVTGRGPPSIGFPPKDDDSPETQANKKALLVQYMEAADAEVRVCPTSSSLPPLLGPPVPLRAPP